MDDPSTNLDRLHDITSPSEVPMWPLAPGWYVLLVLLSVAAIILGYRAWRQWRANAYRREALRQLAGLQSAPEIATLLRRTALAWAPRQLVADKTGEAWLDWLTSCSPAPMPPEVRSQLGTDLYAPTPPNSSASALRDYAARWITTHRPDSTTRNTPSSPC